MKKILKLVLGLSLLVIIGLGSKVYAVDVDDIDLEIVSIEFDKPIYKAGDVMVLTLNVRNNSPISTDEAPDQIYAKIGLDRYTWQNHMHTEEKDLPNIAAGDEGSIVFDITIPEPGSNNLYPEYWTDDPSYTVSSVLRIRNISGSFDSNDGNYTFAIDNTPPEITWNNPINGETYDGTITLKAICNEECDYINFWWRANDEVFSSASKRYHYVHEDGTVFEWGLDTLAAELWGDGTYVMEDGTYYLYAAGKDLAGNWARTEEISIVVENRMAEIIKPEEDEVVFRTLNLEAYLYDNEDDYVDWAVRKGTCAAATNTVLGNVDYHYDVLDKEIIPMGGYNKYLYTFSYDITDFDGGMYCFIFNPRESGNENSIRLTREFYIAERAIHGGGQIIEGDRKPKENLKISFGGQIWDLGNGKFAGDWEINFHNVGNDDFDKSKFHGEEIEYLNYFGPSSDTCTSALNFKIIGKLGQEDGWSVIFRAGDYQSPGQFSEEAFDTIRITLKGPEDQTYDTHNSGEFSDESTCVGTARTGLDNGNITIQY